MDYQKLEPLQFISIRPLINAALMKHTKKQKDGTERLISESVTLSFAQFTSTTTGV